jgi:hypothetical protein
MAPAYTCMRSSEMSPFSVPIMSAIIVSSSTWPVKALVDATPISGPTCR